MSEMVDRVAAALREAVGGNVHMNYAGAARHVVAAMREPTDDMPFPDPVKQYWRAMIDEALK